MNILRFKILNFNQIHICCGQKIQKFSQTSFEVSWTLQLIYEASVNLTLSIISVNILQAN